MLCDYVSYALSLFEELEDRLNERKFAKIPIEKNLELVSIFKYTKQNK